MSLSKYIRELLPEHDTVIIPGLGAFISTYKSAQVDEESGEMTPPSKEVTFEPKIKNNDGLLAGKIAQDEDLPLTEAYRKLEYEREEILYRLDKGETVALENIGEFHYDKQGEVLFTSSGKDFLLLDAYGLEAASLKEEPEESPEEKVPPEENEEKEKATGPLEEKAPAAYAGASLNAPTKPPSKKNRSWWLLLFLIPVIGGVLYLFLRETPEPPPPVEVAAEQPPREEIIPPADTVAADTVPVLQDTTEIAAAEITDSTGFITPDSTKFYLIRGSFEDYENARKFYDRLKREGYEPFHLGKHGSFYLVGINVYDNEIEAYGQQYNYLDKHPESGVWIYIPGKSNIPNPQ